MNRAGDQDKPELGLAAGTRLSTERRQGGGGIDGGDRGTTAREKTGAWRRGKRPATAGGCASRERENEKEKDAKRNREEGVYVRRGSPTLLNPFATS